MKNECIGQIIHTSKYHFNGYKDYIPHYEISKLSPVYERFHEGASTLWSTIGIVLKWIDGIKYYRTCIYHWSLDTVLQY